MALRVLVVSSNPLARAGMSGLLEGAPGVEVAGSTDPRNAADFLEGRGADVVLMELAAADLDDVGSIDFFTSRQEPVVALTANSLDVQRVIARGISAVLPGNIDQETLVAALIAARHGLLVIDRAEAPSLVQVEQRMAMAAQATFEQLTSREREVLQLMAGGLTNRQIARRLSLSEHTVKFHATSVLGKLQSHSRTEAVARAISLGWLPV
jgi:DNA-binding NarL/FixJ family response regulator